MLQSRSPSLILPLLSGIALVLSFPDFSWGPLAWVGLIPMLSFLVQKPGWGRVFVGHGLLSLVYFGGVLYWIPKVLVVYGKLSWLLALPVFLLLLLLLGAFLAPFSLLTRLAAGRSPIQALICAPAFWLVTELLRNYYLINGFPWALLGYSQYAYHWIIQIADVGGVYLVSFLVVMSNAAWLASLQFRKWKFLTVFATLMVLANLYGAYRAYLWKPATGTSVQVGLVQPNIALAENNEYYAARYFETLPELYRRAVQDGADWVIFPEAQNPYFFGEDFYYTRFQQNLAARNPAYLLFNSTSVERDSRYFNSAYLLDPDGKPVYRYDKMHLVPFGEYIPFKEWLNFAQPLVREVGEFAAGADFKLGQVEGIRFATLICYEGIFPELAREYQRRGAELLVIVTNDAWYGPSGAPRQHLEMAAFRAVETRRTVLRCANSGYSAVIDPLGRFRRLSGLFREELLRTEATACTADTVYAHAGDWLNLALACATLAVSLVTARHSGQRAQRAKRPRKAQGRRQPRGKEG